MRDDKLRAYLFDYGGTLDTGGLHWGLVFWRVWRQAGVPVEEDVFRRAYVYAERTLGQRPIVEPHFDFRQTLQAKVRLQMESAAREGLEHAGSYIESVVEGAYQTALWHTRESRRVLEKLKKRYSLALVSNFYGNLSVILKEFSLDSLFPTVVESAAVGLRKPDERIFRMAVEALRLEPWQVAVVGDSLKNDILPARAIGCPTVWLRRPQWNEPQDGGSAPGRTIDRLEELLGENEQKEEEQT